MRVKNRNGEYVPVKFEEITERIKKLSYDLNIIKPEEIVSELIEKIYDGIPTSVIDTFAAEICHSKASEHPHYNVLASRLVVSDHQKNIQIMANMKYSKVCELLYNNTDQLGKISPLISENTYKVSQKYMDVIDNLIDNDRDFYFDYFGFKTLYKGYLLKVGKKVVETPQHMLMRVAIGIHGQLNENDELTDQDIINIMDTYDRTSQKLFTHATPTLFNAGTKNQQMFSCFLLGMDDSIESIFKVLTDTAKISKWAGGIGIHPTAVRSDGAYIRGTGGTSDGIVPMMKVFNDTARYINQGGKRAGSFAMYVEPWHSDIQEFLKCKLPHGDENRRAKDLFYAMWIPDIFMRRVKDDEDWSLMDPSQCPGLDDVYGEEFDKLYQEYERNGNIVKTIKARDLMNQIITLQIETGNPYMCYKDAANKKSNQKNVGTIKSSNLCSEIMEYSDSKKYACCVLGSMVLPSYVENGKFNHEKLAENVRVLTKNLNKIIDINYYPVIETKISNMSERPIGIGVQGLADVFFKLKLPYDSEEAVKLDKEIAETIYYNSLWESMELSKVYGPYETYEGSPISNGLFQFDLWEKFPTSKSKALKVQHSGRWDWDKLKREGKKYGYRNSLQVAYMPTASTSQIMGSVAESFEPITSNCYVRKTKSGDFIQLNKYLAQDLIESGMWRNNMKDILLETRGSIQSLDWIPDNIKNIYKTVWETKQKSLIDHSLARGVYIDQSQSLNLYFETGDFKKIYNSHMYGWENGLKTGSYYIRTQPAANAANFTIDSTVEHHSEVEEDCLMCSS